jgi:VanZ family protein
MKPLFLWLVMVFVLSVYPFEDTEIYEFPHADKVGHFVLYAITGTLLYNVLKGSGRGFPGRWALPLAVVLASVYGLGMEAAQDIVGYRDFSLLDGAVNALGALCAVLYMRFARRTR